MVLLIPKNRIPGDARCWVAMLMVATFFQAASALAGPYAPAAGVSGSTAIALDSPAFVAWAEHVAEYLPGTHLDATWQHTEKVLGPAQGTSDDVVSLGRGGQITLRFTPPITNGPGWDFAVFENSFRDTFLELAYVEVSSNGIDFIRFPNISLTPTAVPAFGSIDPTDIDGLAGKYRQGFGTPFDLTALADQDAVIQGRVDLTAISHIRLVDIVGDGSALDSDSAEIYDPYPTNGSAGFDLDAVGVSNGAPFPQGKYTPPETPPRQGEAGIGGDIGCFIGSLCWE